jgi:hypothetical protein
MDFQNGNVVLEVSHLDSTSSARRSDALTWIGGRMSIERKQFLVWLTIMVVFGAGAEVLMQTHPEFFGPDRPAVYRQLPAVNTAFRPR